MHTAPVTAVLVCHDGEPWLPEALASLRASTVRPRHIVAVDTGSTDRTAELLEHAATGQDAILDEVRTLAAGTGFPDAVATGIAAGVDGARGGPASEPRQGEPGEGEPRGDEPAEAQLAAGESAGAGSGNTHEWIWVLHDDCAPQPGCLAALLNAVEAAPGVGVLGPLALDWADPRLIVEAGLSTDAGAHRWADQGLGAASGAADSGDGARTVTAEQSTEVLAVPSAGALIRRSLWTQLGGFDAALPLLREDLDFGWRANAAGSIVLSVPIARIRHARAFTSGARAAHAAGADARPAALDRSHGLRTYLVNCTALAFVLGLPRLALVQLARAVGFLLLAKPGRSAAELRALGRLVRLGELRAARRARAEGRRGLLAQGGRGTGEHTASDDGAGRRSTGRSRSRSRSRSAARGTVGGLFISRPARMRRAVRALGMSVLRRQVQRDAALGRLAEHEAAPQLAWAAASAAMSPPGVLAVSLGEHRGETIAPPAEIPEPEAAESQAAAPDPAEPDPAEPDPAESAHAAAPDPAEPDPAEPAKAEPEAGDTETLAASATAGPRAGDGREQAQRPGPGNRASELVFVEVPRGRILAATLLAPPVLLVVGLLALALVINWPRLGLDLAGGRLLPVGELSEVWSSYLASWHPAGGGTSAHAPPALALLGVLGALLFPLGGPPAGVALLLVLALPAAGLSAYFASRPVPAARWVRALVAAGYALLPPALAAIEQGRLGVVVAHVLLPPVLAGIASVLQPSLRGDPQGARWLSSSVILALGLAILGAFSPATYLVALVGLLLGFVVVAPTARMARRISSLAVVGLLPIALLLPWPITLVTDPELVVHGIGARVAEAAPAWWSLLALDPGGPGAVPTGAIVVLVALAALALRPSAPMGIGLAIAALGVGGTLALQAVELVPAAGGAARPGWAGAPLLIVGAGLLLLPLLAAGTPPRRAAGQATRVRTALAPVTASALLGALGVSAVLAGNAGVVRPAGETALAPAVAEELRRSGESALELDGAGEPPRQSAGGLGVFGDDDLPLPPGAAQRLSAWQQALRTPGPQEQLADTVAAARAAGVRFVVLPPGAGDDELLQQGGELLSAAAPTADGRAVLRLNPAGGEVTLIAPELSRLAVGDGAPPGDVDGDGISPVQASLPDVRARVSDGAGGRLLVLAATQEAGWRAEVDGEAAAIVPAWGHQVAVEVPTRQAEVVVEHPGTVRTLLLLAQAGAVLFTVVVAIPAGRGAGQSPSTTSGSRPR